MRPALVLDTNVLLDWWVFRDARVAPLVEAVAGRRVQWLASPRMRDEFAHMLVHRALAAWAPDAPSALAGFDRQALLLPEPPATTPTLRCRDADDQVFIDLALVHRAKWLLTRDKALLTLASRARRHGLEILAPEYWAP